MQKYIKSVTLNYKFMKKHVQNTYVNIIYSKMLKMNLIDFQLLVNQQTVIS